MSSEPARPESWHLDKKVPISLIVVLMLQFAGGAMWLARIEGKVAEAAKTNAEQQSEIDGVRATVQAIEVSAGRVAERLDSLRDGLLELKDAQRETNSLLREVVNGKGSAP